MIMRICPALNHSGPLRIPSEFNPPGEPPRWMWRSDSPTPTSLARTDVTADPYYRRRCCCMWTPSMPTKQTPGQCGHTCPQKLNARRVHPCARPRWRAQAKPYPRSGARHSDRSSISQRRRRSRPESSFDFRGRRAQMCPGARSIFVRARIAPADYSR